jgi:hypothetical protein
MEGRMQSLTLGEKSGNHGSPKSGDRLRVIHRLHHEVKHRMINAQNLTVEDREWKYQDLENTAIKDKDKVIDTQNLTVEDRERKHQSLKNMRTLHVMTKHKSKTLTDEAVTVKDQRVSVSTMTQVDKKKFLPFFLFISLPTRTDTHFHKKH